MADGEAYSEVSASLAQVLERLDAQARLRDELDDYWSVRGVPIDVRAMAKAAAKDRALSLGDWLTDAIIRHARGAEPAGDLSQDYAWPLAAVWTENLIASEETTPAETAEPSPPTHLEAAVTPAPISLGAPPLGDELSSILDNIKAIVTDAGGQLEEQDLSVDDPPPECAVAWTEAAASDHMPESEQATAIYAAMDSDLAPVWPEAQVHDVAEAALEAPVAAAADSDLGSVCADTAPCPAQDPDELDLAAAAADLDLAPVWTPPVASAEPAMIEDAPVEAEIEETWIAQPSPAPRRNGLFGLFRRSR